ncbi:DMT family transporter [Streptomyces sp. H39-S7]|uniref:DMT family transporter n=1 Tax=Streptomyces sp. H39-S7 TaxID=3004357 RepID=UPI0022AEDB95|nr:DMT family transporter [Streptomyces sp. H39-S7]MCZ4124263.1 DMT family transporter [Streptomyces sp. H39-S7]
MNSYQRRGALLAAFACVLVGASFTANGALVDYPHAGGQALRYGIAFALLALLTLRGARDTALRLRALTGRHWLRLAVLAATGMVGFNLAVLAAERSAQPAVPGVLVGCAPIVVAVLVPLLSGRRPARAVLTGALFVAGGAFAVQGWGGSDTAGLMWSVAALGGEVAFAVIAVPLVAPLGPLLLSTCVCGFAAVEAGLLGLLLDGRAALRLPDTGEALALGWQAVGATVVGFVCWYAGMQRIGAERATLFSGLIPVSAALTAPLVGVGTFGPGRLAGSLLVAAGVAVGSGLLVRRAPEEPRRALTGRAGEARPAVSASRRG